MKILAISGSVRSKSTNTNLLKQISYLSSQNRKDVKIEIFSSLNLIPIFSPDREGENTPSTVLDLCKRISLCDGILISSPEYIRSIPGGLKNTIDWLVSRNEIIGKPIALVHASHRGDDALQSLRRVLSTISENFNEDIFLQIPLIGKQENEIKKIVTSGEFKPLVNSFIESYIEYIQSKKYYISTYK